MITKQKYVEYLISTPINYTCFNLSEHLVNVSHDVVSNFLKRNRLTHSLKRTFFTTLKNNRLVSLSKEEGYIHLDDIDWTSERLQFGAIVKLKKVPFKVKLFKQVEEFHRDLKQLTGSEKCQCRKARSQRNHLACCYHVWISLKVKATALQKTLYQVRVDLFSDYLRAELRNPRIQAYSAS